jgi:hypothetical protein
MRRITISHPDCESKRKYTAPASTIIVLTGTGMLCSSPLPIYDPDQSTQDAFLREDDLVISDDDEWPF